MISLDQLPCTSKKTCTLNIHRNHFTEKILRILGVTYSTTIHQPQHDEIIMFVLSKDSNQPALPGGLTGPHCLSEELLDLSTLCDALADQSNSLSWALILEGTFSNIILYDFMEKSGPSCSKPNEIVS